MRTWREYPAWLKGFSGEVPEERNTPEEIAAFEAATFHDRDKERRKIRVQAEGAGDAFRIVKTGDGYCVSGGSPGILYGTYALIRQLLTGEDVREGESRPSFSLRMLDGWDNMDGSVERGYSGRSLWFENGRFSYDRARIRQLGRMLASVGINVLCINNVNVHAPAQRLLDDMLGEAADFAAILRPFGIRLMLSVDFSQPMESSLSGCDPLDPEVRSWWERCAERVWSAIPDLAGFLVKADSEHRPGPNEYGRTHAEGANMLADAIAPYGGMLLWRAFVYNCMQDWRDTSVDRPCAAYEIYHPLDGMFRDNVILQVKYGPYDFQVREPVSPLFFGMDRTALAMELQLAQEYTGHQIDLFSMPPMWRELFDAICETHVDAVAAVSNLGRDANWTGHPFAALNLFAYGCFAWDRDSDPAAVIRSWIRLTYDFTEEEEEQLLRVLAKSRDVYEKYTSPLGLCWMVKPGVHYGPSPYGYEFDLWGTYNRADRNAVGIDRTAQGTGYVLQYPEKLRSVYEDPERCPEKLLLFFHRLPYSFRMRDGRTLIQRIYDDHFEGYEETLGMQRALEALPLPENDRDEILTRMAAQVKNAAEWRDVVNTFFFRFSGFADRDGRDIYP